MAFEIGPAGPDRIVIINDFSIARGGATGLALRSAVELRSRGIEVVLLTGDGGENRELEALGIELVGLGGKALLQRSRPEAVFAGLYNTAAARGVHSWIRDKGRPNDVYHLHGWSKIFSPAIFGALKAVRNRLVLHAHDFFLVCPNGAYWNYQQSTSCHHRPLSSACISSACDKRSYGEKLWRLVRGFVKELIWPLGIDPPRILLIHPAMRAFFLRAGVPDTCLTVVRNPAEPFCRPPVNAAQNRGFLFVGRLEEEKGPMLLAQAARRARVPLTVIGEGPLSEPLRHAHPEVEMLGWCDRQGLASVAARTRALVMPSLYPEPFGLVAAEALGAGLPVVIAKTAFLAQEVVDGGAGTEVTPTDGVQFAGVLRELAKDDHAVAAMSAQASLLAASVCSDMAGWCNALLAVYRSLAAHNALLKRT